MRLRLALITVAVIGIAVPVRADCGFEPAWRSIDRAHVAAVFSGTVWKGDVSRMMLIYHPNGQPAPLLPSRSSIPPPQSGVVRGRDSGVRPGISGFRPFYLSRHYVVVAYRMTDEERTLFKLQGDREYLATTSCGGIFLDEAQAIGYLDRVGPGRAPQ